MLSFPPPLSPLALCPPSSLPGPSHCVRRPGNEGRLRHYHGQRHKGNSPPQGILGRGRAKSGTPSLSHHGPFAPHTVPLRLSHAVIHTSSTFSVSLFCLPLSLSLPLSLALHLFFTFFLSASLGPPFIVANRSFQQKGRDCNESLRGYNEGGGGA